MSPLHKLRAICKPLPDASETTTFGHPTFQVAGKTFAVLDDHERDQALCVVVKLPLDEQQRRILEGRAFPSKFGAKHGWTAFVVERDLEWDVLKSAVVASYRQFAGKRRGARV
jgi:predicted DNA-binding protein (MmcQ/YjbR family)